MQRSDNTAITASYYDDLPLSRVLFRFVWPFWLFKDASRGDRYARAAAYRHNRRMRIYLPSYLMKWLLGSVLALAGAAEFGSHSASRSGALDLFALIAAGSGIVFACSVCVLLTTSYLYLYLSRHDS